MDDLETLSNYSDNSDSVKSNISTLSGLSNYGNEFAQLRHLADPLKYPIPSSDRCTTPKQSDITRSQDDEVRYLSQQLYDCQKAIEEYKYKLDIAEKQTALKYSDKIENLLIHNKYLENQLEKATSQIERLIKTESRTDNINEKLCLEKQCQSLNTQLFKLQRELTSISSEKYELELENKDLRRNFSNTVIENDTKNACINELKKKISSQHIDIQNTLRDYVVLEGQYSLLNEEFKKLNKTDSWYKNQLEQCRKNNKLLSQQILEYRLNLNSETNKVSLLNIELSKIKNKYDKMELEALQEKEVLFKKLEILSNEDRGLINTTAAQHQDVNNSDLLKQYETTVQELTEEINRIKSNIEEHNQNFDGIVKENSELISKCVTLQKTIQQNETNIEELENYKKNLLMKFEMSTEREKQKQRELLYLQEELSKSKIELTAQKQEKELIENTVDNIRDTFNKFKDNYENMKCELHGKNSIILQLQKEKQDLFMSNNWRICELEKTKEKDEIIKKLETQILNLQQEISHKVDEMRILEEEVKNGNKIVIEKDSSLQAKNEEIQRYSDVLSQYKKMVEGYEEKLADTQSLLKQNENHITNVEENIQNLKKEVAMKDYCLKQNIKHIQTVDLEFDKISEEKAILLKELDKLRESVITDNVRNNNLTITDILSHIYEFYKLDNKSDDLKFNLRENNTEIIKSILCDIEAHLQSSCSYNEPLDEIDSLNKIKDSVFHLDKKINEKAMDVQNKMDSLKNRFENCLETVQNFNNKINTRENDEVVQQMRILLQVKELEMKEIQKKYEKNNRTLLRKVKEHMKGRNAAEKHNSYLQELHNSIFEENNTLKLTTYSKDLEIENLSRLVTIYKENNGKLRQTIGKLQDELNKTCDGCRELLLIKQTVEYLEHSVGDLKKEKDNKEIELTKITDILGDFRKQVANLKDTNSDLSVQNAVLVSKVKQLELVRDELEREKSIQGLHNEMMDELKCDLKSKRNGMLEEDIEQKNEHINFLSNELQIVTTSLSQKTEELKIIENSRNLVEQKFVQQQEENQCIITSLKNQLRILLDEISAIKRDKFFFQRLSNDMRFALKAHVDLNRTLKEQIRALSKEKEEFNSLPNILPDISGNLQYNETYINQLLTVNMSAENNPLKEIKSSLNNLREEIISLQDKIKQKKKQNIN